MAAVLLLGSRYRARLACCSASSKCPSLKARAVSLSSFLALILLTSVQPAPAPTNKARIAVAPILDQESLILLAPFEMKDAASAFRKSRRAFMAEEIPANIGTVCTTADRQPASRRDWRRRP